jgi:hypothetical protein
MTPTPATEFFAALTDLLLGADAHPQPAPAVRRPYSCNACRDTGDTESGRACNWCGPQTTGSDELIGDLEDY